MIVVDGKNYNVKVIEVNLDIDFLYKYAERTENFDMQYELGAVYYNQSLKFGVENSDNQDFVNLIKLLSTKSKIDGGTGHNVQIWTPFGKITFLMYPNKLTMKLNQEKHGKTWWSDASVKFIAVKPVERW